MISFSMPDRYDFIVKDIAYIVEKEPNPLWKIYQNDRTNYYILRFSTKGEAFCCVDDKLHTVKRGDLLFLPKNAEQFGYSNYDNPWAFYSVAFDMDFLNSFSADSLNSLPGLIHCTDVHFPLLFAELNRAWLGKEIGHMIKCRGILMEILYLMLKEVHFSLNINPHNQKIERVLNIIQTNYTNAYSVDELAEIAGLSTSYFRVVFKRATGLTSVQYQNNIKINKAKDFLLSGNYNVSEAADSVGFRNIYYFSELFKKITGMSPINYIKNN